MLSTQFAKPKYGVAQHTYGVATDEYEGERSHMAYSSGNRSGQSFVFGSKDITPGPGRIAGMGKLNRTTIYGAAEDSGAGLSTPVHPLGEQHESDRY